eukprot:5521336-Prymnesium_polylepis.1
MAVRRAWGLAGWVWLPPAARRPPCRRHRSQTLRRRRPRAGGASKGAAGAYLLDERGVEVRQRRRLQQPSEDLIDGALS